MRPEIQNAKVFLNTKDDEKFQNEVIRPILKGHHDFLFQFVMYQIKLNNKELPINDSKKIYVLAKELLTKNLACRNTALGIIIGQMNCLELTYYLSNEKEMKKRIIHMLIERIAPNIV